MNSQQDTIAAIATPNGKGGIGIIRVSGERVPTILQKVFNKKLSPRFAHLCSVHDDAGNLLDKGIVLYFKAPNSYTGEHVFEWQGHGGPIVLNLILKQFLQHGARIAKPGEFTERAYLNDKIDLAQAEAVADLIQSSSAQAVKAAMRSLDGTFSKVIHQLLDKLIYTRSYLEAALDFPEEEIDFLSDQLLLNSINNLKQTLVSITLSAKQGRILKDGLNIVILGSPNAGKSSLLNSLAGHNTAIVTDIAGTTRDILKEHIHIDGIPLHIIDTAGLQQSEDVIEQEGIKRAWAAVSVADRVLLVIDDNKGVTAQDQRIVEQLKGQQKFDIIYNKIDLSGQGPFINSKKQPTEIGMSAKTGAGLNLLLEHLKKIAGFEHENENIFSARARHISALKEVEELIQQADEQLQNSSGELAAESLRLAQRSLSYITGEFTSDDLLGEIFSSFCIGK